MLEVALTHPPSTLAPMEITTAPGLLEALRGNREERPLVDRGLAGGLRAWLDDELAVLLSSLELPMMLTPRSVTTEGLYPVPGPLVLARAALVGALVTQRTLVGEVTHPMDDALGALESDEPELATQIHELDPDAFAQLAAEVAAHDAVLARRLGLIPGTWLPRTNERLSVALCGGDVVLSAQATLVLGPPALEVASVCLLEVTTSVPDEATERRLSVLALLETLRSGAAPLRVASLSTATGETLVVEGTDQVLTAGLRRVVDAVTKKSAV